jgi:4-amino-4-deoxy-L-arabinose transferase-like glycosyltransferase
MQIYSAIASLICGVSSKLGMFIAVTLPNIFCSILIFLIARKLFDEKIGLIAMLIYGFCDFSIAYSIQICAWSFGIALYIIILYLLIGTKGAINKYQSYLLFLCFALLILTHPVPTTILVIPLIILFVSAKLFKSKNIVSGTLVISFIVGTLSYWIYASYTRGNVEQNFFSYIVSPLYYSLTTKAAVLLRTESIELTTGASATAQLFFESMLNILGFGLLVLFGLLGGLILLYDKRRDPLKLSLILITLVLFALPFGFGFFGIRNIMNYRWFVYGYVTLAILAAIGLYTIIGQRKNTNKKIITVFLIIFVVSFFMTTNTMCNHDSPIYFKGSATRLAFSEQELSLRDELINAYSGPITTDYVYHCALIHDEPYPDPEDIKFYSARYSYEDFCNDVLPQSLFIWRDDYKDRPIELISPSKERMQVVFGENFEEKLESGAYNRIYCNEQVTAYLYIQRIY